MVVTLQLNHKTSSTQKNACSWANSYSIKLKANHSHTIEKAKERRLLSTKKQQKTTYKTQFQAI